jgi:hypothetical protein
MDIESIMLSQAWWLLGPSTLNRDSRYSPDFQQNEGGFPSATFILDYSQLDGEDKIAEGLTELPIRSSDDG